MKKIKEKSVRTSLLTDDCFLIQIFGISQCDNCEWLDSPDCDGKKIRMKILAGLFPKDSLPDEMKRRERYDEHFRALQQMIENVKDDPIGRSELVDKLF